MTQHLREDRRPGKFGEKLRLGGLRWVGLLAVMALVVTACAVEDESPDDTASEEDDAQEQDESAETEAATSPDADRVGRIEFALSEPTAETNRAWAVALSGLFQIDPVLETLIGIDPTSGVPDAPGLAERWEVSDDFRTWRFFLREGAEFHHGWGEFTAADVLFSHEMQISEEAIGANRSRWEEAEVTAASDYEVVFEFEQPQADGELLFSNAVGELYIYSSAQWDAEGIDGIDEQPAGTGYFEYQDRVFGESVTYSAFDAHWSGDMAGFDEMTIRWVPEDSTRLSMLLAGEVDIAEISMDVQEQATDAGMVIIPSQAESMQTYINFDGLYYNEEHREYTDESIPWVADVRVRQAMNKAIDKDEMIEFIYGGNASIVHRAGFLPHYEGWNDEWVDRYDEMYGYDPERAVELIREAGFEPEDINPGIYSYSLGGQPEIPLVVEAVLQYFTDIGIDAYIIEQEYAVARENIRNFEANEHLVPLRNSPIRPVGPFTAAFHYSRSPAQPSYYSDELDGLIDALHDTDTAEDRDSAARAVGDYLYENFVEIPLVAKPREMAVNPERIAGWTYPGSTAVGTTHWHLIEPAG